MGVNGARGKCPACRTALGVPASTLVGERTCPRCDADLWVLGFSKGPVFFPRRQDESLADLLIALGGPALGGCARELEAALQRADHFDLVELLWEVEEELRKRSY